MALTFHFSLRPSSRCAYRGESGVICSKCVFPLPNRSSISHHNIDIGRLLGNYEYYQRPYVSPKPIIAKFTQGLKFLHFLLYFTGLSYECDESRPSRECLSTLFNG